MQSAVVSMTSAINDAASQVSALAKGKRSLEARQTTTAIALANLVTNLLLEVGGALNNVIATLGLRKFQHCFGPYT